MKNIIITLIAITAKLVLFYFFLNYCIEIYDMTKPFYKQSIVVWIVLYLPLFMGMESIINLLISKKKNEISNEKKTFEQKVNELIIKKQDDNKCNRCGYLGDVKFFECGMCSDLNKK